MSSPDTPSIGSSTNVFAPISDAIVSESFGLIRLSKNIYFTLFAFAKLLYLPSVVLKVPRLGKVRQSEPGLNGNALPDIRMPHAT